MPPPQLSKAFGVDGGEDISRFSFNVQKRGGINEIFIYMRLVCKCF